LALTTAGISVAHKTLLRIRFGNLRRANMSDTCFRLAQKNAAICTATSRFLLLLAVLLGAMSCSDGGSGTVELTLRADAVEPAQPVDVMFSLDGHEERRSGLQPGELLEIGAVNVGTVVRFQVTNSRNAGQVRANVLIDNCFRATTSCSEPGCIATAEYTAAVEECRNY
jgi:hypothetical protein